MTRRWRTGLRCESFMDTGPARFAKGSARFSLRIRWWRGIRSKRKSAAEKRSRLWSCKNEEMATGNQKLENGKLAIGNGSLRDDRPRQVRVSPVWYTRRVSMANLQRGALMKRLQLSVPLAKAENRTTRLVFLAAAALAMLPGISRTAHAQAPKRT